MNKGKKWSNKGEAASRMAWLGLLGTQGDEVRRRVGVEEGEKKEGKGVRDGRMRSRRVEGLTITLGSTDKDGGQMLSPVFSGCGRLEFRPQTSRCEHNSEPR